MTAATKFVPDNTAEADQDVMRVVVCGEVNSGKSTVINALLRAQVLPDLFGLKERPFIQVRHGDEEKVTVRFADGREETVDALTEATVKGAVACTITSKLPHLKGFEIIELPFMNERSIDPGLVAFMADADLLVWTTIASQAWRLSEKTILDRSEGRPGNAVLVVSRADKLRSADDREKLLGRLERETPEYFRHIVMMHGSDRLIGDAASDSSAWQQTAAPSLMHNLAALAEDLRKSREAGDAEPEVLDAEFEPEPEADTEIDVEFIQSMGSAEAAFALPDEEAEDHKTADVVALKAVSVARGLRAAPADNGAQDVAEVAAEPEIPAKKPSKAKAKAKAKPTKPETTDELAPKATVAAMSDLLPAFHGCLAVGLASIPDEGLRLQFLKGEIGEWAAIGPLCTKLGAPLGRLDADGAGEGFQMHSSLRKHQVMLQSYPKKGVVLFMVASSQRMNHGIARTAFTRLARAFEQ